MNKPYQLALHIFRRDLRLADNSALIQALALSANVIPCFIFDPRQIDNNAYKSDHALQFMARSLQELDQALKEKNSRLYFFYGVAEEIVKQLLTSLPIEAVFVNRDYTPFSRARDQQIEHICQAQNKQFHCYADALLHEPEEIHKANGEPYTIFTPFFRHARQFAVTPVHKNPYHHYYQGKITTENTQILPTLLEKNNDQLLVKGGRVEALRLLKALSHLTNYHEMRDFPAVIGTTHLSAHNKFGTLSIRELYATICQDLSTAHTLINELYWRDFFTHIAFHYPHVFGRSFHQKYANIAWSNSENHFRAWCEGRTGFPIVDAGMRELNTTGYMHNRVRMITASFLTKDLHIDWRWGEKYFAEKLTDYDPAVNNGNWQWVASTGCDAQPYFRIFNPWLQQERFDADCVYIKHWVSELANFSPKQIHQLSKNQLTLTNYPAPIVNHAIQSAHAKTLYT